jgi:hypothetical protein
VEGKPLRISMDGSCQQEHQQQYNFSHFVGALPKGTKNGWPEILITEKIP